MYRILSRERESSLGTSPVTFNSYLKQESCATAHWYIKKSWSTSRFETYHLSFGTTVGSYTPSLQRQIFSTSKYNLVFRLNAIQDYGNLGAVRDVLVIKYLQKNILDFSYGAMAALEKKFLWSCESLKKCRRRRFSIKRLLKTPIYVATCVQDMYVSSKWNNTMWPKIRDSVPELQSWNHWKDVLPALTSYFHWNASMFLSCETCCCILQTYIVHIELEVDQHRPIHIRTESSSC